jgi:anti-sigma factor (TIGR02949 family)
MDDPTMTCERARTLLGGYLDNELTPSEARAVASHLESCPACRQQYAAMEAVGPVMRHRLPRLTAPDLLRSRVTTALRTADRGQARTAAQRRSFWFRQIAAGLAIAVASSAVTLFVSRQSAGDSNTAVHNVVTSHIRSLMTKHLTDVVSNNEHNVKPWFDGKVAFAPDVPRLDSVGFPLVGGRVDSIGHERVAALVYGRRKHLINVLAWPAKHSGRAGSDEIQTGSELGYNVVRWVRGDLQYAAVSDLAMVELRQFVGAFRAVRPAVSTQ